MAAKQRRDKGEGSFWQDQHGQWWAKAERDGRRKRARATSRADAKAKAVALAAELALDLSDDILNMTVQVWLSLWLAAKKSTVKPSTYEFYARHAGYCIPLIGDILLRKLEARHVRVMLTKLGETALKPQSVAHVRSVLMNALNMAMTDYPALVKQNAAKHADPPTVPQFQGQVLGPDEQAALLAAVEGVRRVVERGHRRRADGTATTKRVVENQPPHRLAAIVHLELALGLRRGELIDLTWKRVDFSDNTLLVRDAKTPSGWRTVPFTDDIADVLRRHKANQDEEARIVRQQAREAGKPEPAWNAQGYVFCTENGKRLHENNLSARTYKMFLRWAGLDPDAYRFHDLRHTAITDWIESGADPKTAQALAGHSDPAVTMRIYAHARAGSMRPAVEAAQKRRRSG